MGNVFPLSQRPGCETTIPPTTKRPSRSFGSMKNKNKQTKFPVARIKKIMQKDEEVGKVAQATPVVISKALELFLALIVEEASKVTVERGSKKVEPYHLKHAIETTEMFDFLKEIVEGVPDPSAGGTIDLEGEGAEGKRKRGKGKKAAGTAGEPNAPTKRRRKKKVDDTGGNGERQEQEETAAADGEGEGEAKSEPDNEHDYDQRKDEDGDVPMRFEERGRQRQQGHDRTRQYRDQSSSEDNDWDNNKPFIPRR